MWITDDHLLELNHASRDQTIGLPNNSQPQVTNLVQIGHNVQLGKRCVIAAQAGIAGSTWVGNDVVLGGQVGVSGHLKIDDGVMVAAKSGVSKDLSFGR